MKNFLFLLHLLLTAIPIGAQTVTYVSNGTIDCYAQGCQTATLNGDTMIFGAWSNRGTFRLNGVRRTGAVYGTLNDGKLNACSNDGNIQFLRLNGLDFTKPSKGSITKINCMADFGTSTSMTWLPDSPGQCGGGGASNCSWKSHGVTRVNGKIYLAVYRQQQGTSVARDSTLVMSPDDGVTWFNPATIGGSGSANGGVMDSPGGPTYAAGVLWKDVSPWDGHSQKMGFVTFVHYCKDESVGCVNKDASDTYTYLLSQYGNFGSYTLARWPKSSMPTLDISTMQYYVCPGYATTVCDGTVGANWSSSLANATPLNLGLGAMADVVYLANQNTYGGVGWNGLNGEVYLASAPRIWGPWTLNKTVSPRSPSSASGVSVFANILLAAVTSVSSNVVDIPIASTTSGTHDASGTLYWDRYRMTISGGGGRGSMQGKILLRPPGYIVWISH
jgi:hypothetical protein